jgi:hypothetical protein
MGVNVCVARAARAQREIGTAEPSRASTKHENDSEARWYRDGTGPHSRRELKAR